MDIKTLSLLFILILIIENVNSYIEMNCNNLRMGQFLCPDPTYNHIDPKTQQLIGCNKETNKAKGIESDCFTLHCNVESIVVRCIAVEGILCTESGNSTFFKDMNCKWTNGHSFETSLLLSVFLGMFGADRFYLGYPAIGLAKFCTLGFMFLGQLIDIILIATQTLGPADGSAYVMPYYGPGIDTVLSNNWTYRLKQDDW